MEVACINDNPLTNIKNKYTTLMVDGISFEAKTETLEKIPLFESFFDYQQTLNTKKDVIYVDRDYQLFEQIYTYIICNETDLDLSKKLTSELEYYGLSLDENVEFEYNEIIDENTEYTKYTENQMPFEILKKVEFELENLSEIPFYVSACGHVFQTTKKRLSLCEYFKNMFVDGRWIESSLDIGTIKSPLFVDIPYKAFNHILNYLRNSYFNVPNQYFGLTKMLMITNLPNCDRKTIQNTKIHKNNTHKFEINKNMTLNDHHYGVIRNHNSQGALLRLVSNTTNSTRFDDFVNDPPITFFQHIKRKHTNTSKDTVSILSNTKCHWGNLASFQFNRASDMINSGYLKIVIRDGNLINWKHNLLYRIIKTVSFCDRGNIVDKIYNNTLWHEDMLYEGSKWSDIIENINDRNNPDLQLLIPLRLFFMHHLSTSLPILKYVDTPCINIEFSKLDDCTNDIISSVPDFDACLELSCHYIDSNERNHIGKKDWINVIHQHQYSIFENHPNNTVCSLSLDLSGSIELIVFTLHTDEDDMFWCGYNTQFDDPLISASLHAQDIILFNHDAYYFRIIDKKESTLNIPDIPIYTYSFGSYLKESMHTGQSSGTLNTTSLNNIKLNLRMKLGIKRICVWAIRKNTFAVIDGASCVKFRN